MQSPLVSIIIPVYKAEATLRRCIDSILSQIMTNFELLLVDDGSDDNSGSICEEYALADSRIRVIHQTNSGVSAARNRGLDIAGGEYVMFVDSDDCLYDTNSLSSLLYGGSHADLIIGGMMTKYLLDGHQIFKTLSNHLYQGDFKFFFSYPDISSFICGPTSKLYVRSLIESHHLRFNRSMKIAEDTVFVFTYLSYCSSILTVDRIIYKYYVSANQSSKYMLNTREFMHSLISFHTAVSALASRNVLHENLMNPYVDIWSAYLAFLKNTSLSLLDFCEFRTAVKFAHNMGVDLASQNYIYKAIRWSLDREYYRLAYLIVKRSKPWSNFMAVIKRFLP